MNRIIKWGVLGLGKIAHKFVLDLLQVDNCELEAVASSSKKRAKFFAKKYGVKKFYDDYNLLYNDENIDIIYIASLNTSHCKHTITGLEHNNAILCEKPIGINQYEVEKMINYSIDQNTFLMEGLWTRFNPAFEQVLEWIRQKSIGKVRHISASFCFKAINNKSSSRLFDLKKGGGSLLDIGIYPLFLAYSILGIPKSIEASTILSKKGIDLQTAIILSYENCLATLYSSFSHNKRNMSALICGEYGEIFIDSRWHESSNVKLFSNGKSTIKKFNFVGKGYSYEIQEVNNCLRKGIKESPKWKLKNSLELIKIIDNVRSLIGVKYPSKN